MTDVTVRRNESRRDCTGLRGAAGHRGGPRPRRRRPTAWSWRCARPASAAATGTAGWATTRRSSCRTCRATSCAARSPRSGRRCAAGRGRRPRDRAVLLRLRASASRAGRGETQVCERDFQPGFTAWGSFAELVALPRADLNLVRAAGGARLRRGGVARVPLHDRLGGAARARPACARASGWPCTAAAASGSAAVMIARAPARAVVAVDIDEASSRARARSAPRDGRRARRPTSVEAIVDADRRRRARLARRARQPGDVRELGRVPAQARPPRAGRAAARRRARGRRADGARDRARARDLRRARHGRAPLRRDAAPRRVRRVAAAGRLVAKTIGLDEAGAELASMGRFAQEGVTVVVP